MKKFLFLSGLVALLLCLAQNASAQYAGPIHRDGYQFVTNNGQVLTDQQLIDLVGSDIYEQTIVGARKQLKAGKALIWGGGATAVAGVAVIVGGAALIASNTHQDSGYTVFDNENMAYAGAAVMTGGYLLLALGSAAVTAGVPLNMIGKSRLNWVENSYNHGEISYNIGLTPNGVGFALRF